MLRVTNRLRALGQSAVTKGWAVWFVVFTALPFTAPFATLDLADLWGHAHSPNTVATVAAPTICSAHPDDSTDDVAAAAGGLRLVRTTRRLLIPLTSPQIDPSARPAVVLIASAVSGPPPLDLSTLVPTLRL